MTAVRTRTQDTAKLLLLLLKVSLPHQILPPGVSVNGNQTVTVGAIVIAAVARLSPSDLPWINLGLYRCIVWRFSFSLLPESLIRIFPLELDSCSKELQSYFQTRIGLQKCALPRSWKLHGLHIRLDLICASWLDRFPDCTFETSIRRWLATHLQFGCLMSLRTGARGSKKDDIHGFTVIALVIAFVQAVGALYRFVFLLDLDTLHLLPGSFAAAIGLTIMDCIFLLLSIWVGIWNYTVFLGRDQAAGQRAARVNIFFQPQASTKIVLVSLHSPQDIPWNLSKALEILIFYSQISFLSDHRYSHVSGLQAWNGHEPWIPSISSSSLWTSRGQDIFGHHYTRGLFDPEHRSTDSAT